jgi:hypothetical protein
VDVANAVAPAAQALGGRELALLEIWMVDTNKHHLGNPVTVRNAERLFPEIVEEHLDLTAVIVVDRAGSVEHSDQVARCQAATRTHLRLEALRNLEPQAGGHDCQLSGRDDDAVACGGTDVVSGRATGRGRERRKILCVRQHLDANGRHCLGLVGWTHRCTFSWMKRMASSIGVPGPKTA